MKSKIIKSIFAFTVFSTSLFSVYAQSDTSRVQDDIANNLSSNTSIWVTLFVAILALFGGTAGYVYSKNKKSNDTDKSDGKSDTPKKPQTPSQ